MGRKAREVSQTHVYHWINRGVTKKHLFHEPVDYEYYLELVRTNKGQFGVFVYHYCLMTNHTHFLLKCDDLVGLGKFSHQLQRRYAYYYQRKYKWIGQVFQRSYKSIPVKRDSYLLECARYIERNPVRAGICDSPGSYPYSSYLHYAGLSHDALITPSVGYLGLATGKEKRREAYCAATS